MSCHIFGWVKWFLVLKVINSSLVLQQSQTCWWHAGNWPVSGVLRWIKELSDTSPGSVIEFPREELQGIVAEINEALPGSRDRSRSDPHIFALTLLLCRRNQAALSHVWLLRVVVNYDSWESTLIWETCLMLTPHCCLIEMGFMSKLHWWNRARSPSAGL